MYHWFSSQICEDSVFPLAVTFSSLKKRAPSYMMLIGASVHSCIVWGIGFNDSLGFPLLLASQEGQCTVLKYNLWIMLVDLVY